MLVMRRIRYTPFILAGDLIKVIDPRGHMQPVLGFELRPLNNIYRAPRGDRAEHLDLSLVKRQHIRE